MGEVANNHVPLACWSSNEARSGALSHCNEQEKPCLKSMTKHFPCNLRDALFRGQNEITEAASQCSYSLLCYRLLHELSASGMLKSCQMLITA